LSLEATSAASLLPLLLWQKGELKVKAMTSIPWS